MRDLFALDPMAFDVKSLLPGDETADGSFDNFADVLTISTAHLERYLSAARQVTRLATGLPPSSPALETFEIPLHVVQDDRQDEDLPFGSRGGIAVRYAFPVDGEYPIKVRLRRQYQDYLMGMGWPQQLDVRLDGKLLKRFVVGGKAPGTPGGASYAGDGEPGFAGAPEWETYMQLTGDAGLEVRVPVTAGPRVVGVSFVRELWEPEGLPQPLQRGRVLTNDQIYMGYAAVGAVTSADRTASSGTATNTPSRRAIFVCEPNSRLRDTGVRDEDPVADGAAGLPPAGHEGRSRHAAEFFESGRRDGGTFDAGIQFALERMLVDPDFLLRVHRSGRIGAPTRPPSERHRARVAAVVLPLEQHSRRAPARRGRARRALEAGDPRTAGAPDAGRPARDRRARGRLRGAVAEPAARRRSRRASGFLSGLRRQPARRVQAGDGAVHRQHAARGSQRVDLLRADYTFVNERLARHYGIPGIYGSRFRRVTLPNPDQRGGLLAHGAMLATTSYPDRTSPVLRGKWLLDNIFGVYVPPPPPDVDTTLPEMQARHGAADDPRAAGAAPHAIRCAPAATP